MKKTTYNPNLFGRISPKVGQTLQIRKPVKYQQTTPPVTPPVSVTAPGKILTTELITAASLAVLKTCLTINHRFRRLPGEREAIQARWDARKERRLLRAATEVQAESTKRKRL